MPKTRELKPAHRTPEPTHDLSRRGSEPSSGKTTPSGPLTERSPKRAMKEKSTVHPTKSMPSDDNRREAYRRMREKTPTNARELGVD